LTDRIAITSADFWYKVVDCLQENWAVVEPSISGATVFFLGGDGAVFDEIAFPTIQSAQDALDANGFYRLAENERNASFLIPPRPPYFRAPHPNGAIYSSGRFWVNLP
jgi:hypothetical protein